MPPICPWSFNFRVGIKIFSFFFLPLKDFLVFVSSNNKSKKRIKRYSTFLLLLYQQRNLQNKLVPQFWVISDRVFWTIFLSAFTAGVEYHWHYTISKCKTLQTLLGQKLLNLWWRIKRCKSEKKLRFPFISTLSVRKNRKPGKRKLSYIL